MKFWWLAFLPSSLFVAGSIQKFYFGADSHGPDFIRLDINCVDRGAAHLENMAWVKTPNYIIHKGFGTSLETALLTLYISIPRSTEWISKKVVREFLDDPSLRQVKYRSFIVTYDKSGDKVVPKVVLRGEAYDELLEYFVMPRPRPAGCSGYKLLCLLPGRGWRNSLAWSDASVDSALAKVPTHRPAIDVIEREVEIITVRIPPMHYILKLFTAVRGDEDPEDTGKALMSGTLPLNRGESPKNPFGSNNIPPKFLQDLGARSSMKIEKEMPDTYGQVHVTPHMIEDLYYLSKLPFEPGLSEGVTERPVWRLHRIPSRVEIGRYKEFEHQIAFPIVGIREESDASFNDNLPAKRKKPKGLSKLFGIEKYVRPAPRVKKLSSQSFPVMKRRRSSEEMLNAAEKQNDDRDFKPPKSFGHDPDDEMSEGIMNE